MKGIKSRPLTGKAKPGMKGLLLLWVVALGVLLTCYDNVIFLTLCKYLE